MNYDASTGSDEDVRQAAAAWFARMRSGASDFDDTAYEAWLRRDPRHRAAIDRMNEHYRRSAVLKPKGRANQRPRRAPMMIMVPLAAMAILVCRAALHDASSTADFAASPTEGDRVDSASERPRQILLADGSAVALDAGSSMRSKIDAAGRAVTLLTGHARFTVAHDPGRPFTVSAQKSVILAVGTIFDVIIQADRSVDVRLIRGRVRVSSMVPSGAVPPIAVFLEPQQHAVVMPNGGVASGVFSDLQESTDHSLDDGMQNFDHVMLSDIVRDADVGSPTKLQLGPSVGQIRVSGRFQLADTPRLAATLAKGLDLSVTRLASGNLALARKPSSEENEGQEVR